MLSHAGKQMVPWPRSGLAGTSPRNMKATQFLSSNPESSDLPAGRPLNVVDSREARSSTQRLISLFKQRWQLLCLVFFLLVLHLAMVTYVKTHIADEGHYVPQASAIIHERGDQLLLTHPTFLDHPSLAKLFIASGILVFGDNPWGWRVPSIIFGIVSVVLFYFICKRLAGKRTALIGSLLLAFENFTFAYSGVGMLDVFSMTFMLASFLFFLRERYIVSGILLALAGLCKLPGLFGILVIVGYWALAGKKGADARKIVLLLVCLIAAFIVLMPVADFAATSLWFNPVDRMYDMLVNAASIKFSQLTPEMRAEAGAARPWEWITQFGYGWRADSGRTYSFTYTPTLFILIVPSLCYMAYEFLMNRRRTALFTLLWFGATYALWIPIALVTDRAMYMFYFLPSVGAVCLAIAFGAQRVWQLSNRRRRKATRWLLKGLVVSYLTLHVLSFFLVSTLFLAFADVFFHQTLA